MLSVFYISAEDSHNVPGTAQTLTVATCKSSMGCLARWERAQQLGLEPPEKVMHLLQQLETEPQEQQGLWANRI